MPELPEVESVRRSLIPVIGRRIVKARLLRSDICTADKGRAKGLLAGSRIIELKRHGKQLAMVSDGGAVLVVHLGMTGQLRLTPPGSGPSVSSHVHARWEIDDGSRLTFRDPRRFGGLWMIGSPEALGRRWDELGPDALGISAGELGSGLAGSRRAIKAALLDQSVLAGVGNIYADEALFVAGIRPSRLAHRLKRPEIETLAAAIRGVLISAIDAGGSTLRDYADASGRAGSAQLRHAVYGRSGRPCVKCGDKLRSTVLAQRTTVYCARCQR